MSAHRHPTRQTSARGLDLLRQFIEHAPAPIAMFDRDMKYLMASRRFLTDYHLTPQELIGRSHYEVFPDLPDRWKDVHQRCLAGATERAEEDPFPRADGTLDWVHWEIQPWYDEGGAIGGIILFSEVITARKQTETALRESERRYREFIAGLPVAAYATDATGRITLHNAAAVALWGQPPVPDAKWWGGSSKLYTPDGALLSYRDCPMALAIRERRAVLGFEAVTERADGTRVPFLANITPVTDASGRVLGATNVLLDITARKQAEEALRQSEQRLFAVLGKAAFATALASLPDGVIIYINESFEKAYGYTQQEVVGKTSLELGLNRDAESRARILAALNEHQSIHNLELTLCTKSGEPRIHSVNLDVMEISGQQYLLGTSQDITERKRAEEALLEKERHLSESQRIAHIGSWVWDAATTRISWTEETYRIYGVSPDTFAPDGKTFLEPIHPDDRSAMQAWIDACMAGEQPFEVECRIILPDGKIRFLSIRGDLQCDADNRPVRIVGTVQDITERKRAEKALAESERQRRLILESVGEGIHGLDIEGQIVFENPASLKMFGWRPQGMIGQHSHALIHHHRADGSLYPVEECPVYCTLRDGRTRHVDNDLFFREDGTSFSVEYTCSALQENSGVIAGVVVSFRDITERTRAEAKLRESEERFRQLAESIREVFWMTDLSKSRMIYISPAYEAIWGRSTESLYASPNNWAEAIHPEDRSRVLEAAHTQQVSGTYNEVYRIVKPDGTLRWIRDRAFPIRDASGNVYRIAGIAEDITDLKQLEEQFLQSQKLEAVGELAGGIAHDFNNNLSAIIGFSDLALDTLHPDDPLHRYITQVKKAGEQSALLTRQLLAFSRKQLLRPRVLDLNALITGGTMMLQRMIGEGIDLRTMLNPECGRIKVDSGQLEQVLMNLVVNARDAMPHGGTLTLETGNVEIDEAYARMHSPMIAGSYVRLAVSDTGCGMDAATLARIFEPFFTTKEIGKGTGLGLSTVYGIMKQSGGYIWVDSEPGQGTTFQIYLPRVDEPLDAEQPYDISTPSRHGSETILLVEDEEMVRAIVRETLQACGYTVFEAVNAGGALLVSERHQGPIDLMVTDVVLPFMSGPDLAQRLKAQRPEMRVLYMSGYTDDALAPHGVLTPEIAFLAKPFTPDLLARKVREVLDAPA